MQTNCATKYIISQKMLLFRQFFLFGFLCLHAKGTEAYITKQLNTVQLTNRISSETISSFAIYVCFVNHTRKRAYNTTAIYF